MPHILSVGTAVPPHIYEQNQLLAKQLKFLSPGKDLKEKLAKQYAQCGIENRYSVLPNIKKDIFTSSRARNEIYKREAPLLAEKAARQAIDRWGGDPKDITHIISVSCTGVMAPGIEFHLMETFTLPHVKRIGINFMGCFGAFTGLQVANSIAKENPKNRILLVCTELCSLHAQNDLSPDSLLANLLFSDGAAACIIGEDKAIGIYSIEDFHSLAIPHTKDKMQWDIAEQGFGMKLSQRIAGYLKKEIEMFAKNLIKERASFGNCAWPLHPGGKSILEAIEKTCQLNKAQTEASWNVLKNYGNMSSATFLFVLEELMRIKPNYPWAVGIGFGPGLSIEGILLKLP